MADRDDEPSLELPSLGGWRRRRRTAEAETPEPIPEPEHEEPATRERRRIRWSVPRPSGLAAVMLVGVAAGLVLVGLTWSSLRACEELQGTSSCGNAGYPMLVLAVVAAVLAGVGLLRLVRAPDPVTTSLLGVGLAAVLALLLLVDRLDRPAMIVVIPLICAATFAAARWLTTTFDEAGRR